MFTEEYDDSDEQCQYDDSGLKIRYISCHVTLHLMKTPDRDKAGIPSGLVPSNI